MNVFVALFAYAKASLIDAKHGCTSVSKVGEFTVEITNRECAFRCSLDLIQLVGASLDRDPVAVSVKAFKFSDSRGQNRSKLAHFVLGHRIPPSLTMILRPAPQENNTKSGASYVPNRGTWVHSLVGKKRRAYGS
jgi:hypothetical protein